MRHSMLEYLNFPQGFGALGIFQSHFLLPSFRFEFPDIDWIQDKSSAYWDQLGKDAADGMQEKRDLHYLLLNGRRIEKR